LQLGQYVVAADPLQQRAGTLGDDSLQPRDHAGQRVDQCGHLVGGQWDQDQQ
jgi:hypothetical protein